MDKKNISIGIIGMGDMGKLYATSFKQFGFETIHVCDLPHRFQSLQDDLKGSGFIIHKDGFAVSRASDFIIYSVEAAVIDQVVAQYGPCILFSI